MNILPVEAGAMNISPDFDAEAQLTAYRSTHKHAMRLFARLDTKRLVYLERHGGDVSSVNTVRTRHNRHYAALGTQSTILNIKRLLSVIFALLIYLQICHK